MKRICAAATLAFGLAACSPEPSAPPEPSPGSSDSGSPPAAVQPPSAPPPSAAADDPAEANLLTLEGLGRLRIGEAVPAGSGWAERGAQISDSCRTIGSAEFPGAYAIVEDDKVRRITVGQRSPVRLAEGIGVGSTEAEVRAAFPGFRAQPHEYSEPPAKYLTAPNAASGDPALRFEIGADGKVDLVHVGTMPVLGYVEGCA